MGSLSSSEEPRGSGPPCDGSGSAYIPNIGQAKAKQIEAAWSRPNRTLPEYEPASASSCLLREWLTHTRILRYHREIASEFEADPWLERLVSDRAHFESLLLQLIQKGYGLPDAEAAAKQCDVLCGCNIFHTMQQLYVAAGHKRAHLAFTLQILLDMERADAISAKLSEVCDRAPRCASAKQQALNLLVQHCYHLKHKPVGTEDGGSLDTREGALARFYECMEDYIDDHKERAFKSSFMEPARCYFSAVGDRGGLDHVNVHGLNWYLALLHAALGIQTPLLPAYHDNVPLGVADFWAGLKDACWRHFSDPGNFGADFEGIAQLRGQDLVRQRVQHMHLPRGVHTGQAKELGNRAVRVDGDGATRRALAVYLERFMFFFGRDFFVRKAFETLNAEVKPEHVGWRKACDTLFRIYKAERGVREDDLMEHCYRDDYFTDLDVERVNRFFAWLGITKHSEVPCCVGGFPFADETARAAGTVACADRAGPALQLVEAVSGGEDADLQAAIDASLADLHSAPGVPASSSGAGTEVAAASRAGSAAPAWSSGGGGVGAVAASRGSAEPAAPEPWLREASAQVVAACVGAAHCPDPDQRASAFESWALAEMVYGENAAGMRRLAKLVVEDAEFAALLQQAVQKRADWLRDAAGIVFRLHCMHREGELDTDRARGARLAHAVEIVVEPFEQKQPIKLPGHFHGALYTQAVTAWLSALQADRMATTALLQLVQRVGRAIVHCFHCTASNPMMKHEIKERMPTEYAVLSPQLWGSHNTDPVWCTFYA